ncbi:MAG: putative flap endonuclease-1-like 5' DNA nuclease [Granulosicoccus sp.]
MILTLISIGLLLLSLWLYFQYVYDESGTNAMSKSDIYSFQWVPQLFTQPHIVSPILRSSAAASALDRAVRGEQQAPFSNHLSEHELETPALSAQLETLETSKQKSQADRITQVDTASADRTRSNGTQGSSFKQNMTSDESKPKRQPLFTAPAEKDDLKKIKGIGPVMERTLNELGVTSFKQLGEFNQDNIQSVSDALVVFPGRIERDKWVSQAKEKYQEKYSLMLN